MPSVSVMIPTNRSQRMLEPCLTAIAQQDYPLNDLEVVVVHNGPARPPEWELGAWPFRLVVDRIETASVVKARNRALELARGDLLVFANDDVWPEPGFVRAHLAAHEAIERPGWVLGAAHWEPCADETVFDRMIQTTSMIFFYDRMEPHTWYGFRHAWTLNLSLRREHLACMRFDERLGPFFFEDLELAYRLERARGVRVWYAPEAAGRHVHRYSLDDYLTREEKLGAAAVRLWRCNPGCFRGVYGADLDADYVGYCEQFVETEGRREEEMLTKLRAVADRPSSELGGSAAAQQSLIDALYAGHLTLKRLSFRRGLLQALHRATPAPASSEAMMAF